jgi:hypothetical protein
MTTLFSAVETPIALLEALELKRPREMWMSLLEAPLLSSAWSLMAEGTTRRCDVTKCNTSTTQIADTAVRE